MLSLHQMSRTATKVNTLTHISGAFVKNFSTKNTLVMSKMEIKNKPVSGTVKNIAKNSPSESIHRNTCNVYTKQTSNRIHINLQELSNEMQRLFCKDYIKKINTVVSENDVRRISFNNLTEDVFRYHLNMQIRKLGYTSVFTRYNEDRGIAEFNYVKKEFHL